ncbi:MAG: carbon storage regulator CsrA [Eubacteriales bacterium]|nr:carbon storage regulator CsrA [Eubacteriales bacterium]MDD3199237.1 carbon storage regulator CsrA [Eubacteriales bacterium]MDD4122154.1 carbon storage regulator CsrA [Eubacteriales bacterium]MDD4629368.1 carbon storage regulator CsrA [Eubacteriales bacterium]
MMLVISRKVGESLAISDNIKITITSLSNDKVTIGIEAPKEIKVVREELLEIIEANKASNEKLGQANFQGIAALIKNNNR